MHRFLEDTLPSFDTVVANLGLHHSGTPTLRTEIDLLVSLFPSPEMKGRLIYRTTFPRSVWARGREAGNEGEEAESRVEKEEGRGKRGSRVWRRMEERDVPSPRMAQPPPTDP